MEETVEKSTEEKVINQTAPPPAANPVQEPKLTDKDEIVVIEDYDFSNSEVVRREFFAHINEPSISFNQCKFYANAACIKRFPKADFAQVLINREQKILALRPCEEFARDSFPWSKISKGKRTTRAITCKLFFAKIFDMMNWVPHFRYKLLGKIIHSNGEYLIAFDLTATEVYQRTEQEGAKPIVSKTPTFPADWQNQFGMPFYAHKETMKINVFDGYAIYSVQETAKGGKKIVRTDTEETVDKTVDATDTTEETIPAVVQQTIQTE